MSDLAEMCAVFGFVLGWIAVFRVMGSIEALARGWLDWQMKLHKEKKDKEWNELLVQGMPRKDEREGPTLGHSGGKEASE